LLKIITGTVCTRAVSDEDVFKAFYMRCEYKNCASNRLRLFQDNPTEPVKLSLAY